MLTTLMRIRFCQLFWKAAGAAGLLAASLSIGCTTAQTSNTARTSTELMLLSNAVDQSLDKMDFSPFRGYSVHLNDKYVDCVDKNYVVAATRHRILNAGARLVDKPEDADVVLELRAGAVGTASASSYLGVPEIVLPGMVTLPEVRIVERKAQQGIAKLGLVAYDPKTNQIIGAGGSSLARSDDSNWYVVGVGPWQNGSVRDEIDRSTSGYAGQVRNRIPNQVVFQSPAAGGTGSVALQPPAPESTPPKEDVSRVWYREQE